MTDVVVIGGGAAGLGTALALARSGRTVTVLERDEASMPESADDAFTAWPRRGAPQVRHSHAFLARLRGLLLARAPDVLDQLLAVGATEWRFCDHVPDTVTGFEPQPNDAELVALACRRTTFEWVLRRAVLAESAVDLLGSTTVVGLEARRPAGTGAPRIVGVHVDGGRSVPGDWVIDASGRNSKLPSWLAEIGATPLYERESDVGILYCSRFYRLADGVLEPDSEGVVGGDLGYMKYGVFPGDSRTFSITLAVPTDDAELRAVLHPGAFDALAAVLPTTRDWLAGGRAIPITDVAVMARLRNRLRRIVVDDAPVATGVLAVGDAAACTNPLYGRGTTLALVHGFLVADELATGNVNTGGAASDGDAAALAVAFDASTRVAIEPWYRASVFQDDQDRAARQADRDGDQQTADSVRAIRRALFAAVRTDGTVWRSFVRTFNLLDPPDAMLADPVVAAKLAQAFADEQSASGPGRSVVDAGPSRDETLRIVAAVA